MKTLLAIINEPKESKDFIRYVADMAADFKANVHLLYVQNPNDYPLGTTGSTGFAVAQVNQNLKAFADTAKEILAEHIKDVKCKMSKDVAIDFSAELGVTTLLAKKLVSVSKGDMVVLEGRKNDSIWTQTESNLEIIRSVDCPVWIIPNAWVYVPFTEIVYATDYKEEDIYGLKKLIALTHQFSPVITALHITDSVDFEEKVKKAGFLELLKNRAAYDHLSVKILNESSNNDIAEFINDFALRVKADLIVVLKENKSFFERIFKSDPAKKIIEKSMLPILVFHNKE
ncbi:MAG: universal stress protein [Bacteroidales bacterium]